MKTDIEGLKLVKVDCGVKNHTGTILLANITNEKQTAKYRITNQCFVWGLKLLGNQVIVSYDDSNSIITSIRPIE